MRATTSPTATLSPCAFTMWSTPLSGAGISMLALSVSSSRRTSSARTLSPSCRAQRTITPSLTDSPRLGMRTSTVIRPSLRAREGPAHDVGLLLLMDLVRAARRARGFRPPDVREPTVRGQDPAQAVVHEVPAAHVPRLLLHPDDLRRVRVARELLFDGAEGERVELLETDQGDRIGLAFAARGEERIVDLAAREQDAPHACRVGRHPRLRRTGERDVVEHGVKRPVREVGDRRHAELVPEEALRGHDDERLPEAAVHLAPERVEVLRRGGEVADLEVVLGAELEPALEPRARVLRPLSLVAVRQQNDEPAHPLPLRLGARDELVDDHLRAVHEVAELRLPADEPPRVRQADAELEPEDGVLREHAVEDAELLLLAADVVERDVALAGLDVVQDGVPLAERAACRVLAGEPDREAFDEQ